MGTLQDYMHTDVKTTTQDGTVWEAADIMSKSDISCLVVVENDSPVGIITRRDIFEKVLVARKNPDEVKVGEVMSSKIISLGPQATMVAASGIMSDRKIKQLPIVDEGKLVGIVTQTDIVRNINKMAKYDTSPITLD